MTACSEPGFVKRCRPAPRGSWQEPDRFDLRRCRHCEPHAAEFPSCAETPDYPRLPDAVERKLTARAQELIERALVEGLERPSGLTPQRAGDLAAPAWRRALTEGVAAELAKRPDELVRRHLAHGEEVTRAARGGRLARLNVEKLISAERWGELCELYVAGWERCEAAGLLGSYDGEGVFTHAVRAAEETERARLRRLP